MCHSSCGNGVTCRLTSRTCLYYFSPLITLFTRYWIVITAVVFWIFPDCNNKLYDAIFAVMYSSDFCNQHMLSHFTTVTSHFGVNLDNAWLYVNGLNDSFTHSMTPQATVTSSVARLPQPDSELPHFTLPRFHFCIHKYCLLALPPAKLILSMSSKWSLSYSFLPPKTRINFSSPLHMPHAPSTSSSLIWPP